jgi:hypothetical protein
VKSEKAEVVNITRCGFYMAVRAEQATPISACATLDNLRTRSSRNNAASTRGAYLKLKELTRQTSLHTFPLPQQFPWFPSSRNTPPNLQLVTEEPGTGCLAVLDSNERQAARRRRFVAVRFPRGARAQERGREAYWVGTQGAGDGHNCTGF